MVWWIVGGVVVVSLLGLGGVLAGLRRRLVELDRVSALAQERTAQFQPRLAAASERLEATLADLERRALAPPSRPNSARPGRRQARQRT
jgi:hypothetical protein